MSRIGKKPIDIPSGVKVSVEGAEVKVEGKSTLSMPLPPHVSVEVKDGKVYVQQASEDRRANAMHGLTRSLIQNMVTGVTAGFRKELAIVGVGYKAQLAGSKLTLSLGFSHPIVFEVPHPNTIVISGPDKQKVGQFAAEVREKRPPEPYKGKGIRYVDERIVLKEGKSVG